MLGHDDATDTAREAITSCGIRTDKLALVWHTTRQAKPYTIWLAGSAPLTSSAAISAHRSQLRPLDSLGEHAFASIREPLTSLVYLELTLDKSAKLGSLAFHTQHAYCSRSEPIHLHLLFQRQVSDYIAQEGEVLSLAALRIVIVILLKAVAWTHVVQQLAQLVMHQQCIERGFLLSIYFNASSSGNVWLLAAPWHVVQVTRLVPLPCCKLCLVVLEAWRCSWVNILPQKHLHALPCKANILV